VTPEERIAALEGRLAAAEGRLAAHDAQLEAHRTQLNTPPDVADPEGIPPQLNAIIAAECRGMSGDVFRQSKRAVVQRYLETTGDEKQRIAVAVQYLREGEQVAALLD
jgi:hypothetical protein